MINLFNKKAITMYRYSISAELIKGGNIIKKVFSPLVKSRSRARLYVITVAERQGYTGVNIND